MSRKCLYPFTNVTVNPMGHVTPCCKYNLNKADTEIETLTLRDHNLEELFLQPAMENIRQQFLSGEEPKACQACWDEEATNNTSMRQFRNRYLRTFDQHRPIYETKYDNPGIVTLDFKFSSLCNLKCRICGPYCSSNWLKESLDTGEFHEHTIKIFSKYADRKFIDNEENFEIFKKALPNLHIIEFYGGEPLMQPEHTRIMEILEQSEYLKDITLYYNTNGTIYDQRYVDIWNKANLVEINISVDDIEERFEYQRFPAKWSEVLENITKFKNNTGDSVNVTLYTTISMYNIYYLPELLEFNYENLKMNMRLNLVHWPETMSIKNLSDNLKQITKMKLSAIPKEHLTHIDKGMTIDTLIGYMNDTKQNSEQYEQFLNTNVKHDDYRNQSFNETFKEYWKLLNETS
jgi:molybdenum cofactor biosynthesis enzyme MoaA